MKTRVHKWGNSLALRIPKSFADQAGLRENALVELTLNRSKLIVNILQEET
jgi:antitoxin MazE